LAVDFWGWLSVPPVLAVLALAVWALRRQSRIFPPNRERIREPGMRNPEERLSRWLSGGDAGW
jgi:hypothetical protein